MKVWEVLVGGMGMMLLYLAFLAAIVLGGIWAVVKLLRHLELIG